MSISMYHASIPVFIHMMGNLAEVLKKGATHATSRKIDPTVLINSRLFPDMYPLARQVQVASDVAKGCAARLAGQESPKFDDNESTFPELLARTDKTVAYLKTFKPTQIDGTEDKAVHLKIGGETMTFKGMPYLLNFALPNFYFHITTAYDILRHNGVELGKREYLGKF